MRKLIVALGAGAAALAFAASAQAAPAPAFSPIAQSSVEKVAYHCYWVTKCHGYGYHRKCYRHRVCPHH